MNDSGMDPLADRWSGSKGSGRLGYLPPPLQFIAALGISLLFYVVFGASLEVIIKQVYGVGAGEMLRNIEAFLAENAENLNPYRFIQMASTVGIFGGSAILISYLLTGRWLGLFDFRRDANMASLLYVPALILLAFPIISLVYFYVSRIPVPEAFAELEKSQEVFVLAMLGNENAGVFLLNFIMIAILPAVFEELLFRGALQRLAGKASNNPHLGILISGILFGLIHGQVFKFLPIAILGILLGYLYWWTRNLWFPILAHAFHNGIQVVLYFFVAKGWVNMDMESPQMLPPVQSAMFAVLFAGMMYFFYYANRKTADEPI